MREGEYASGARNVIRGVGGLAALAVPALVAPALATAPVATMAGLLGSTGAGLGTHLVTNWAGEQAGLTEDQAGLMADVLSLGVGGRAYRPSVRGGRAAQRGAVKKGIDIQGRVLSTTPRDHQDILRQEAARQFMDNEGPGGFKALYDDLIAKGRTTQAAQLKAKTDADLAQPTTRTTAEESLRYGIASARGTKQTGRNALEQSMKLEPRLQAELSDHTLIPTTAAGRTEWDNIAKTLLKVARQYATAESHRPQAMEALRLAEAFRGGNVNGVDANTAKRLLDALQSFSGGVQSRPLPRGLAADVETYSNVIRKQLHEIPAVDKILTRYEAIIKIYKQAAEKLSASGDISLIQDAEGVVLGMYLAQ